MEGFPAGVSVLLGDIQADLARRRLGYGRGARMKFEADEVSLSAGIRHGITQGGPVAIRVANTEWPKWETVMSPHPVAEEDLQGWSGRSAYQASSRSRGFGGDAKVWL
jgi:chorismate synthase